MSKPFIYVDGGCFATMKDGTRCGRKRPAPPNTGMSWPLCEMCEAQVPVHPLSKGDGRWCFCITNGCAKWARHDATKQWQCAKHGGEDFFHGTPEAAEEALFLAQAEKAAQEEVVKPWTPAFRPPKEINLFSPCCGNPLVFPGKSAWLPTKACECGIVFTLLLKLSDDESSYQPTLSAATWTIRGVPFDESEKDFGLATATAPEPRDSGLCAIIECHMPKGGHYASSPYCEAHGAKYDEEWMWCAENGCMRTTRDATEVDVELLRCAQHGGEDYVPRTVSD